MPLGGSRYAVFFFLLFEPHFLINDRMAGESYGRRIWDEQEYAEKAAERKRRKRQEALNVGAQDKLKAHEFFADRQRRIRQVDELATENTVTSSREAGFYCDTCHRRFKDNLKFLEHLNSKEHLMKTGFDGDLDRQFSLQEVIDRLEMLKKKIGMSAQIPTTKAKHRHRKKRESACNAKVKSVPADPTVKVENAAKEDDSSSDMAAMMGFTSFGGN